MESYITISELARLMNVSVHQIRYFEEKGALFPACIGDNQYRLYGIDEVYQLAQILLLRQIGMSVPEIANNWTGEDSVAAESMLNGTLEDIDAEILRLQQRKRLIKRISREWRQRSNDSEQIMIKQRDRVVLTCFLRTGSEERLSARQLLDEARAVPDLFERDIYCMEDRAGSLDFYVEGMEPADRILPQGQCLVCLLTVADHKEVDDCIEQMRLYAAQREFTIIEPPVVIEKSYLSLFSGDRLHVECLLYLSIVSNCNTRGDE